MARYAIAGGVICCALKDRLAAIVLECYSNTYSSLGSSYVPPDESGIIRWATWLLILLAAPPVCFLARGMSSAPARHGPRGVARLVKPRAGVGHGGVGHGGVHAHLLLAAALAHVGLPFVYVRVVAAICAHALWGGLPVPSA